ncbi:MULTISPECIES: glycoside hydrolase family 95 protein [unclassified Flavobacterium]|jgi:alpha-L-fucosidase 2|uniref:glycoside hydrolase family 95 protein n=1 Tax=unclassified Flavobacterium TaxID=196869 RepID=UPI0025BD1734|nr:MULTISPECIES: glycoside hydrolase family 95 protein [unclassified Flavobacterium]
MKSTTLKKLLLVLICYSFGSVVFAQSTHILWYNQPANYFEESLVLGNGKLGATVFGGVDSDKIYLNDATLWSGEPVNANMNPEAYKNLPAIREALKNEDYKLANELNKKIQGKNSESFAPLGTMNINSHHNGSETNYYRELDISKAVSKVSYEIDGVKFTREYFVSAPDQIMIIRLTSSKKGALNFDINSTSLLKSKIETSNNTLQINGFAPIHENPGYTVVPSFLLEKDRGTRFTTLIKIKNTDGTIVSSNTSLGLKNGTEALIFVSIATSFNGFDKNPATEGLNDKAIALENLTKAFSKTFKQIQQSHIADYQKFYNRVSLNLGKTEAPNLPTDERLMRYSEGKEDKNLEVLYFQYGRYLLISSSRTKGVPANLQGIWNPYLNPPWSSNYTTNINAEENYWLAENTNLSEMHTPMLSFIKNVSQTGKITAKTFYGLNGWAAAHNSDIWAMSNPVGNFGKDDPSWACWNMAGAWLSTHIWEHYAFTQDKNYLKNEGYEIMRGAAQFCLEWLIKDKNGYLITSPSTSPENKYVTPDGFIGATMYGGTADLAMIRECFDKTIKASKILNIDAEFRAKIEEALSKLYPYQIGKKGNLQEWYFDWNDEDPKHRHQSHLFGLFPGNHITPLKTPELANACRKTLEIKGDETTGWSKGWRINLWARLWDGNHAYKMYRELLRYVDPDQKKTEKPRRGGGTYPNLFDAHPPFQIDGNFGGAAAVAEMLVQSDENEIRLLPALPDAWESGSVKGICARGGFEISMEWSDKTLKKVSVFSKNGGNTTLISGNKSKPITLTKGQKTEFIW